MANPKDCDECDVAIIRQSDPVMADDHPLSASVIVWGEANKRKLSRLFDWLDDWAYGVGPGSWVSEMPANQTMNVTTIALALGLRVMHGDMRDNTLRTVKEMTYQKHLDS